MLLGKYLISVTAPLMIFTYKQYLRYMKYKRSIPVTRNMPYVFLSQRLANEVRVIICCEVLKSIHYLLEKKNEKIGSESKPFSWSLVNIGLP